MQSFAVLWRDSDTDRPTSLMYDDERDARVAKELIEAARIAAGVRSPARRCSGRSPSTSTC